MATDLIPPPDPDLGPGTPDVGTARASTRRWPWLLAGAAVLVALLASVALTSRSDGADDLGAGSPRPDASVTPPGAKGTTTTLATRSVPGAARSYFEAFATDNLSQMGTMIDVSAGDSSARLYAVHQIAIRRASGPSYGSSMEVDGSTVVLSQQGHDLNGDVVEQSVAYEGFELEGGELAGFSVDGTPVEERIRAGDSTGVTAEDVTVNVVTAYQAAQGDLFLNLDITNGRSSPVELADYDWALVTLDGRQVAVSMEYRTMAPTVAPGATAGHVVVFEQVGLGGTLKFHAFADDFSVDIGLDVIVPE